MTASQCQPPGRVCRETAPHPHPESSQAPVPTANASDRVTLQLAPALSRARRTRCHSQAKSHPTASPCAALTSARRQDPVTGPGLTQLAARESQHATPSLAAFQAATKSRMCRSSHAMSAGRALCRGTHSVRTCKQDDKASWELDVWPKIADDYRTTKPKLHVRECLFGGFGCRSGSRCSMRLGGALRQG